MALRGQSGAADSGTRVTTASITYAGAANIVVGDLIVLVTCMDTGGSEGAITDPSGFTAGGSLSPALADVSVDGGNSFLHCCVKIAVAGDAGTPTYSTTFANAAFWSQQVFAFSGRVNSSVASAFNNQVETASSAEANTPTSFNITGLTAISGDDILVVAGSAFAFGRGTSVFTMAITGYSNALANIGTGNNAAGLNALSQQNAPAGATGTLSSSWTSTGGAQTLAIGAFVFSLPLGVTIVPSQAEEAIAQPLGLRLGTPVSRLRSGLEDTTPSPGPVGLPQGEISVALPTTLRLGTPLSRLRSGFEDTTPAPGPVGLPQGEEQVSQPFGMRLGTPFSRLRGVYSDVPPSTVTTGVLNLFAVSASSATFDPTGSPGFMNESGASASVGIFPLSGGMFFTGASASTATIPPAGGVGANGASASAATVAPAGGVGAFSAAASAAIVPLSGGVALVGVAASAGFLQLSGGVGLFGAAASIGSLQLSGAISLNGVSASAAVYTAIAVAANFIFLTGVSPSSGQFDLQPVVSTVIGYRRHRRHPHTPQGG